MAHVLAGQPKNGRAFPSLAHALGRLPSYSPRLFLFGPARGRRETHGVQAGMGPGHGCSGGHRENTQNRLPETLPEVFGENSTGHSGYYPGASPGHAPQVSCGRTGDAR